MSVDVVVTVEVCDGGNPRISAYLREYWHAEFQICVNMSLSHLTSVRVEVDAVTTVVVVTVVVGAGELVVVVLVRVLVLVHLVVCVDQCVLYGAG